MQRMEKVRCKETHASVIAFVSTIGSVSQPIFLASLSEMTVLMPRSGMSCVNPRNPKLLRVSMVFSWFGVRCRQPHKHHHRRCKQSMQYERVHWRIRSCCLSSSTSRWNAVEDPLHAQRQAHKVIWICNLSKSFKADFAADRIAMMGLKNWQLNFHWTWWLVVETPKIVENVDLQIYFRAELFKSL